MRSPLTGLIAYEPVKTPVFSRSVDIRSISVSRAGCSDVGLDLGRAVRVRQLGHQRVLGRQDHEGRAVQRVRAGW